uniref:Uncharacterized protein n=1 Tax=Rhizophagus irregularis (strain DAOM 181602 / DAOM 197198 / MUCL 43194) TaxID=747089 RepID=U9SWX8_RHIID
MEIKYIKDALLGQINILVEKVANLTKDNENLKEKVANLTKEHEKAEREKAEREKPEREKTERQLRLTTTHYVFDENLSIIFAKDLRPGETKILVSDDNNKLVSVFVDDVTIANDLLKT